MSSELQNFKAAHPQKNHRDRLPSTSPFDISEEPQTPIRQCHEPSNREISVDPEAMPRKRNPPSRKRAKSAAVKRRVVRITSNPFLNFFLSVCKLKGNQTVEKIARNAAVDWRKMNYLDKTPYYLLADEAKKRKKRSSKKREPEEYKYSDWDGPMMVVPRRRLISRVKSDTEVDEKREKPGRIQQRRKSEGAKRRRSGSSMESDAVLTSDVEGVDSILDESEKDLKRRKFTSDSSFGLSTSVSGGTLEVLQSDSSGVFEGSGKDLHKTHDFYQ